MYENAYLFVRLVVFLFFSFLRLQIKSDLVFHFVQATSRGKVNMRYGSRGTIRHSRTTSTSPRFSFESQVTETRVLNFRGVYIQSSTRPETELEIRARVNSLWKLGVSFILKEHNCVLHISGLSNGTQLCLIFFNCLFIYFHFVCLFIYLFIYLFSFLLFYFMLFIYSGTMHVF